MPMFLSNSLKRKSPDVLEVFDFKDSNFYTSYLKLRFILFFLAYALTSDVNIAPLFFLIFSVI